ncbi:hypothetical protein R3W88_030642 [Solanum pinnatisectum]|uniref:F-box associated beta-propeller type 1 domain-containing protein n=1 Tax=Solanum pinnatisectum TaxID=50273 RepID=A0AAV9LJ45_9SOLN|nr:hypothetical protein R3W88_030642 [Solanum pinnatisectum]
MKLISEPYFTKKHLEYNRNSQKILISQWYGREKEYSLYCSSLSSYFPVQNFHHGPWGLGYDSTSDDYKILKIDEKSRSEILRLKSGSWKVTDKHLTAIHPILTHTNSLVFVHGACHWIGLFLAGKFLVISFSISDEMYGEIPLPEQMYYSGRSNKQGVSSLGEMFCAYYHHKSHTEYYFKIWVMKKIFNIQVTCLCSPVVPKYRCSDGDVLLCCIHLEPRAYVLRTSKGPFGLWPQSGAIQIGFVYTESLVFPKLVG